MDEDLDFDLEVLTQLLGDPLPLSNSELQTYWFRYERDDGVSVTLSFSAFERGVALVVRSGSVACSAVQLHRCDSIRVLEVNRRTFEITSARARCFVSLDGDTVLDVEVPAPT